MSQRSDATQASSRSSKNGSATKLADARARMYHDLIFECAEALFGRKGYQGTTMQDIADEAGVSLKTLYAAYASKQDLYTEINRARATAFIAALNAASAGSGGPLERIGRRVTAYATFLFEHADWLRIHVRTRVAWAFRPDDEANASAWEEGHEDTARVLREGMAAGVFYEGDAEEMAIVLQTIMQVQIARALERGEDDVSAVADAMMVSVRRLICPPQTLPIAATMPVPV